MKRKNTLALLSLACFFDCLNLHKLNVEEYIDCRIIDCRFMSLFDKIFVESILIHPPPPTILSKKITSSLCLNCQSQARLRPKRCLDGFILTVYLLTIICGLSACLSGVCLSQILKSVIGQRGSMGLYCSSSHWSERSVLRSLSNIWAEKMVQLGKDKLIMI